ncbi:MAG: signal peptide peptidase SppA [Gammaproteobacteria bacterium]|nr:signal peptide peptidase SppA [Gammaproteobacteria bacterium]
MFNRSKPTGAAGLPGNTPAASSSSVTNSILQELAIDYMHDKKIKRRWKIALFILVGIYLIGIVFLAGGGKSASFTKPHTALVELNGIIGTANGISADQINKSLRKAFESKYSKGVVLRINSPGGTPVQSAEINDEIRRLRKLYPAKPMHAVLADVAASGGYFVAVAADQIYANQASIVGSIGVRMDGFGFVEAMKKYGIERRSITAGENKSILDPFLPVQAAQKAHAERMLDNVHQQFIEAVKDGRGDRISDAPEIYSGLFWSGGQARELGLIDAFGSLDSVARDVIGAEEIVNYTIQPSLIDQIAREFGVAIGAGIANNLAGQFTLQ